MHVVSSPESRWLPKAGIVKQAQETQKSRPAVEESGTKAGELLGSSMHVNSGQTKNGLLSWLLRDQSINHSMKPEHHAKHYVGNGKGSILVCSDCHNKIVGNKNNRYLFSHSSRRWKFEMPAWLVSGEGFLYDFKMATS
jgi:hypothetical protein